MSRNIIKDIEVPIDVWRKTSLLVSMRWMLTRFRPAKGENEASAELIDGKLHIVIRVPGTIDGVQTVDEVVVVLPPEEWEWATGRLLPIESVIAHSRKE